MTDRRINISITIPTTAPDALADVSRLTGEITEILSEHGQYPDNVSVHEFDLDEVDDTVYVVLLGSGLMVADDEEHASQIAASTRGVVVELPVLHDHRGEVTA